MHFMTSVCFIRSSFGMVNRLHNVVGILNNLKFYSNSFKSTLGGSMNAKPPNILVYTGDSCSQKFKSVEQNLLRCLKPDNYIVYHLLPSEIKGHPWMDNSLLLVVSSCTIDNSTASEFEFYYKNFGSILFECSKFTNSFLGSKCDESLLDECLVQTSYNDCGDICVFRGNHSYSSDGTILCCDMKKKPLIWKKGHDTNVLVASEVYLVKEPNVSLPLSSCYNSESRHILLKCILQKEFGLAIRSNESSPQLSAGYFFCDNKDEMTTAMKNLDITDISSPRNSFSELKFNDMSNQVKLPVYFHNASMASPLNFDSNLYFSKLDTDVYGHSVVYFPVITTTMEAAEQLSNHEGIVIIADCQISGKGRGTNKWISPVGCAMFTLHLTVHLSSYLGKKLTLLQHIASLAVVHGIKSNKMYEKLDLKIKWPNDIYHGKVKIGGLIVTSVLKNDVASINIGWGINVSNSCPTSCINDVIDSYNKENSCSLPHIRTEEVIAFTVSQMEFFVKDFINYGSDKFLTYYYSYWMHNNIKVTLRDLNKQGTVIGIDDFGFLKVKTDDGEVIFQPDGNRFDIMKNLIHSK